MHDTRRDAGEAAGAGLDLPIAEPKGERPLESKVLSPETAAVYADFAHHHATGAHGYELLDAAQLLKHFLAAKLASRRDPRADRMSASDAALLAVRLSALRTATVAAAAGVIARPTDARRRGSE